MSLFDITCFHLLKNVEFYTTVKLCMKHSSGIDPDLLKFKKMLLHIHYGYMRYFIISKKDIQ